MDYLRGGDLRYHICYKENFNDKEISTQCLIHRIHHRLHCHWAGVHSLKKDHPQRHQAWEHCIRREWLCSDHWFWHRPDATHPKIDIHENLSQRDSRLHGSLNPIQARLLLRIRLLCSRSNLVWTRDRAQTILRKKPSRNTQANTLKSNQHRSARFGSWLESLSRWFY